MAPALNHRHALEGRVSGFSSFAGIDHLSIPRRPAIVSVLAHAGHETAAEAALQAIPRASARVVGPGQWLVVSQDLGADELVAEITTRTGPAASVIDSSDAQVLLCLDGPNVRRILAKCVAVDVHRDVFPEGRSTNALVARVSANIARTGPDRFEIVVGRSLALGAFEEILEMGREFELSAGFAD